MTLCFECRINITHSFRLFLCDTTKSSLVSTLGRFVRVNFYIITFRVKEKL